ncbi:MFS general substrate transporter [Thozetella sp. PMI_491]|nr:MFS general substrate transporter [Thozetella sp. PMI_491]
MSINEEKGHEMDTSQASDKGVDARSDLDVAYNFIKEHDDASNSVNLTALRRKIDLHIVPIMFLCYTMQFLDKVILNYAAVMGMNTELGLVGNNFSDTATFLFVALLCFEVPNTYLLQKVPAAKWLGANVLLWGVATASGGAAKNYPTLLASRIFIGVFEATIGPSLLLISSRWYTKSEQAPRFSFWYLGLGIGQIVGGAVSYGFQGVIGASLSGWRIMFITLGCITILIGLATILLLPDTPMKAGWLSDDEKVSLLKHISVNQTGVENRVFRPKQILEALMDPQIYLMILSTILLSVSSGVVTTYSATLIKGLGYTPRQSALMNMPSGAVSIFFTLLVGFGVRKQSHRWAWVLVCIIPGIIGGALMSFLPSSNKNGILAGIYLVNAVVAPLAIFYNWTAANVAGSTKRAFAAAMVSGSFSIGNIIGPQTFQARDAPEYRPAKLAVMGTLAGCAITTMTLFAYYMWENKRRGNPREASEETYKSPEAWASMTDKENKNFRYTY